MAHGPLTDMLGGFVGLTEVGNEGDDAQFGAAFSTAQGIDFEDTPCQPCPGRARFAPVARAVHTVVADQALIRRIAFRSAPLIRPRACTLNP